MTDTAAVKSWYDSNAQGEHERLQTFGLEYALSLRAINQCIDAIREQCGGTRTASSSPSPSLKILDLGGGTGRYSVALAQQSHKVTYTDISPASVALGVQHAASKGVAFAHAEPVDALHLQDHREVYRPSFYDVVLCMGPLYHLLEAGEREQVIESCARLVRPGGYVCVAFVTRWAHLRDVARRDPGRVVAEREFYDGYLGRESGSSARRSGGGGGGGGDAAASAAAATAGGRYDRVPGRTAWHVSGGREAWDLVERAGRGSLRVEKVVACEGFLGGGLSMGLGEAHDDHHDDDDGRFERWVEMCAAVAEREEMWGASDHLLVVARRNDGAGEGES